MVEYINQMTVEGFFFDDFEVLVSGKKFKRIRLVQANLKTASTQETRQVWDLFQGLHKNWLWNGAWEKDKFRLKEGRKKGRKKNGRKNERNKEEYKLKDGKIMVRIMW